MKAFINFLLVVSWFYFLWIVRNIGINLGECRESLDNIDRELFVKRVGRSV